MPERVCGRGERNDSETEGQVVLPKVSCILPTGYGDKYVFGAIQCFLDQTYHGELELVVVDNNDESIHPLLPPDSRIKYTGCSRQPVGRLRNLGTQFATGEVCITWDEDDWSAPKRVESQVQRLLEQRKAVTGWDGLLFWDEDTQKGYKYVYEPSGGKHPPYACGTSQCYLKSWWEDHKFVEHGVEDYPFSDAARNSGQLDSCDAGLLCVARIHKQNIVTKKQVLGQQQFAAVERSQFPQEFFASIKAAK
jgi:glycosyltransferase involved in cell wall biosynthesis